MKKLISIFILIMSSSFAQSEEWTNYFKISELYISAASNYHFRVYGMNDMQSCSASPNWAYVNESDTGSQGKISSLLSAYVAKKNVKLYIYGNDNNRCQIIEIRIID